MISKQQQSVIKLSTLDADDYTQRSRDTVLWMKYPYSTTYCTDLEIIRMQYYCTRAGSWVQ